MVLSPLEEADSGSQIWAGQSRALGNHIPWVIIKSLATLRREMVLLLLQFMELVTWHHSGRELRLIT